MTKYCIVPENCRILAQLATGMEMEPEERELLERGFIRHVEITPGANLWEILVWCDGELPAAPQNTQHGQIGRASCRERV